VTAPLTSTDIRSMLCALPEPCDEPYYSEAVERLEGRLTDAGWSVTDDLWAGGYNVTVTSPDGEKATDDSLPAALGWWLMRRETSARRTTETMGALFAVMTVQPLVAARRRAG
jgi:hypothetical protein